MTTSAASNPEVELIQRATDVLGPNRMPAWMNTRIPSLDNQTPLSLMATERGRKQVERVLGQIEHGIF